MPQGTPQFVPDQITGANTTDFQYYVGMTKALHGGGGAILGLHASSASIPAGAGLAYNTQTAGSTCLPFQFADAGAAAGVVGVVGTDIAAASSNLIWCQTAGTFTASVQNAAGLTAARGVTYRFTDTAGSMVSTGATTNANATLTQGLGAVNVQAIASDAGTAVLQLIPFAN